jgi:hypothetical protein
VSCDLIVGSIDFNNSVVVDWCLGVIIDAVRQAGRYRRLVVKHGKYFSTSEHLPKEPGWYIIVDRGVPLYVGKAEDLDDRLNSNQGSLDNFAHSKRKSDPQRNFIKKFIDLGKFGSIWACFVTARELADALQAAVPLGELDLCNVEKFIDINRGFLELPALDRIASTRV